jgi:hypothetical protein
LLFSGELSTTFPEDVKEIYKGFVKDEEAKAAKDSWSRFHKCFYQLIGALVKGLDFSP